MDETSIFIILFTLGFVFVILLAIYIYFALALKTLARKLNVSPSWWAWVPVLQAILLIKLADKKWYEIFWLFLPLYNVYFIVRVWMIIARKRGFDELWGLAIIVPMLNIILPGLLAWHDVEINQEKAVNNEVNIEN